MSEKDIKNEVVETNFFEIEEEEVRKITPTLPVAPNAAIIREQLSRIPAQLEYLEEIKLQKKTVIQDLKTLKKAKEKAAEIQKSKIRQEIMKRWQEEMKNYLPNIKKLFADFKDEPNMNKIMMQQLIKDLKPEKPTKNDLDDYANLKTEALQSEIYQIEKRINLLEADYEAICIKINKYENTYISVRAHVRLLEREYGRSN